MQNNRLLEEAVPAVHVSQHKWPLQLRASLPLCRNKEASRALFCRVRSQRSRDGQLLPVGNSAVPLTRSMHQSPEPVRRMSSFLQLRYVLWHD